MSRRFGHLFFESMRIGYADIALFTPALSHLMRVRDRLPLLVRVVEPFLCFDDLYVLPFTSLGFFQLLFIRCLFSLL